MENKELLIWLEKNKERNYNFFLNFCQENELIDINIKLVTKKKLIEIANDFTKYNLKLFEKEIKNWYYE